MSGAEDRRLIGAREAGVLLQERLAEVVRRWEEAARLTIPAARHQPPRTLIDSLPAFLRNLAEDLSTGTSPHPLRDPRVAHEHAEQRAGLREYTLDQVIAEYHLIRSTLFDVLETERLLDTEARAAILERIDLSVRNAAARYVAAAQEELGSLQAQHQLLVQSTRDYAIFTMDAQRTVTTWSMGGERIFGYSASEIIGQTGDVLFTPADRERGAPDAEMRAAVETGVAEDQRWHRRKDGSRVYVSGVLLSLNAGPHPFAKVVRDVSHRRFAEEERDALLAREQMARDEAERTADRLRRLQTVTDIALAHRTLDDLLQELLHRIRKALAADTAVVLLAERNELVARASEGLEEEVRRGIRIPVGTGFAGRVAAEQRPIILEDAGDYPFHSPVLREAGLASFLGVPLRVDGHVLGVLHVGMRSRRTFGTEEVRLLELVADRVALAIEHASLYEDVKRRNARLRLLSDTAGELLFSERPGEFVQHVYERLAEHLGLEVYLKYVVEDDGSALRLQSSSGVPPEVAEQISRLGFGEGVSGVVARDRKPRILEDVQHITEPGTGIVQSFGLTAYACLPLIAREQLIGTISFGTSGRLRFEPDEIELMCVVSSQVAVALDRQRLIRELRERAVALEEADRRKNEFLAMLAHELRNPLAGIANATYVLDQIAPEDPARRRLRAAISRQTGHLSRMVDDLLDVSRITQEKVELRREPVDLRAVVREALDTTRTAVESRGHVLEVVQPEEPLCVNGDPTRLEQVVANLLNNAAKYTEPGGRITVELHQDDHHASLCVRDTGIGIAPGLLPRVFDLFTQADRSLDRSEGGLGIGLTLVKSLTELHGGVVEAHSAGVGHGSEFVVRLPLVREAPEPAPRSAGGAEPATVVPARRALIIEDNPDAAETLADILDLWGMEVRIAPNGPAALNAAGDFQPDVVLLDIGLPGMDGYEVARRLRSGSGPEQMTIVALTGYGQEEDRRRSREAGVDHHLVKPVRPEQLQGILGAGDGT